MSRKCLMCSKELSKSQLRMGNKYCSRSCYADAIRVKEKYICKNCGIEYMPKQGDRITYCSRECSYEWKTKQAKINEPHVKAVRKAYKTAWLKAKKEQLRPIREAAKIKQNEEKELRAKQKNEEYIKKRTKSCEECGVTFVGTTVGMKYCGKACSSRAGNRMKDIKRRTRLKENGKIEWDISIEKLIKRDNNVCHICRAKCDITDKYIDDKGTVICGDNYPSVDHVRPVSNGGTHTWGNVKLAHRGCNTVKGARKYYERSDGQVILAM